MPSTRFALALSKPSRQIVLSFLILCSLPSLGFIRYRNYNHEFAPRGYYHRPPWHYASSWRWHTGHWYHGQGRGLYAGRDGWWWIVGPSWHYYERPVYPYPEVIAPTYVVEVNTGADEPAANLPPSSPHSNAQFYYCSDPAGYYPAIEDCPGGWAVTPAPPPH